jgi:hypothetical protein
MEECPDLEGIVNGGPLTEEIVKLLDSTWLKVKLTVRYYA